MLKVVPPTLLPYRKQIFHLKEGVSFSQTLFCNFHLFTISRTVRQLREPITTELCVLSATAHRHCSLDVMN